MDIRKIDIKKIKPARYNPRVELKPGDQEYENLRKSLEVYGYVDPVIWNKRTGNLVGGHQRYKILVAEGLKEIEVSVVDLSPSKEKMLNLALNKIQGRWDDEKLAQIVDELMAMPDFDPDQIGFDDKEISQLLDKYINIGDEEDFDVEEAIDRTKEARTKIGDIIRLGSHKIFCGDCSQKESLSILFDDKKVHLLFIDPPYNIAYDAANRPKGSNQKKSKKKWKEIQNDSLDQKDYENWLKSVLKNIHGYLNEGSPVYIWNGFRQFGPMYEICTQSGYVVSCVITWAKEHFALSYADYNQATEFCLYGWKEGEGAHKWYGATNESTLWTVDRDPAKEYIHPTQKPVALAKRAISNSSKRGDIVVDTFLGSGTTLIASEILGRSCYGMEIDPHYCDAIVARYIALFGEGSVSQEVREQYIKEETHEG